LGQRPSFNDDLDRFARDPDREVMIRATLDEPLQYHRFKAGPPTEIHALEFTLGRYKVGAKKGAPKVEQRCLDAAGKPAQVLAKAMQKGEQAKFEPMAGAIPREVMDLVPLVYIDTKRTLRDALPANRYSLLRQLMDDIDRDFNRPDQLATVQRPGKSAETVSRAQRWEQLMQAAMKLLRKSLSSLRTTSIAALCGSSGSTRIPIPINYDFSLALKRRSTSIAPSNFRCKRAASRSALQSWARASRTP
jgi:hypothetical protein